MSSSKFYASQAWTFVKTLVGVGGQVQKPKIFKDFSGSSLMQCIDRMYGKNLLEISITLESIKMLVINVYFSRHQFPEEIYFISFIRM